MNSAYNFNLFIKGNCSGVFDTTLCDNVCQWLAAGQWFSLGTPFSSTNKTDGHDMTEILLKVALNITNQTNYKGNIFRFPFVSSTYILDCNLLMSSVSKLYFLAEKVLFRLTVHLITLYLLVEYLFDNETLLILNHNRDFVKFQFKGAFCYDILCHADSLHT